VVLQFVGPLEGITGFLAPLVGARIFSWPMLSLMAREGIISVGREILLANIAYLWAAPEEIFACQEWFDRWREGFISSFGSDWPWFIRWVNIIGDVFFRWRGWLRLVVDSMWQMRRLYGRSVQISLIYILAVCIFRAIP
jgi:hypothetical protein